MSSPLRDKPLTRTRPDSELHNMSIVDDLLTGLSDWRSVPDIVRLTFKAILDILKSQSDSLKHLELELPAKALKSDLSQFLMLKSSQNDFLRSLNEVKQSLESKISVNEVYSLLDEKANKTELAYQLSSKATYEEVRNLYCEKNDLRDLQSEVRVLRSELSQSSEEQFIKMQTANNDIEDIVNALNNKVNREEFLESLEEKANKQSVANALHRKANKIDMESLLAEKVENNDFQQLTETLEQVQQNLNSQLGVIKIEIQKLLPKSEYEEEINSMHILRKEFENKSFSHFSSLEGFVSSVRSDLDELSTKCLKDTEKIFSDLNRKVECSEYRDQGTRSKQEVSETFSVIKSEFSKFQDISTDRSYKLEQCCKVIQDEIIRLHEDLKITNENLRLHAEKNRENIEDGLRSYQNFMANVLEENKRMQIMFESLRKDVLDFDVKKIDKLDVRKLIDSKVDSRELHDGVEKVFKDCNKILVSRYEELRELLNRKEKELILLIDGKPGIHEVNSLILDQALSKKQYHENYEERYMRADKDFSHQYIDILNKNH